MNALEQRNADVKYARSLGIVKPHTMKGSTLKPDSELAQAIAAAEASNAEAASKYMGEPTIEDDPFFDDDPEVDRGDDDTPEDVEKAVEATREAWLLSAVDLLRPLAKQAGADVPHNIAVSVGFTGTGRIAKVRGTCYKTSVCEEKRNNNIFISPLMKDVIDVLRTLLHELLHASDDGASGHKGHWAKCAKALGFEGKGNTGYEAGPELRALLQSVADELPAYPHLALSVEDLTAKKQTTRLLKAECPQCTSMPIRVTKKHADTLPFCGAGCVDEDGYPQRFEIC